jgi:hypothetical protein
MFMIIFSLQAYFQLVSGPIKAHHSFMSDYLFAAFKFSPERCIMLVLLSFGHHQSILCEYPSVAGQ